MAGDIREGGASASRRKPSRGSRPRQTPLAPPPRRPPRLAADPAESRPHPEWWSLFGLRLHPFGVLLALLVDVQLFLEELPAVHLRVKAAALEQLPMRSALDDASLIEDQDLVGVLHRGEAVRDDDARALAHHAAQPAKDLGFGVRVHGR